MGDPVRDTDLVNRNLQAYLPADLFARFARSGAIPATLLAAECRRLRHSLDQLAALVPFPSIRRQIAQASVAQPGGDLWQGTLMVAEIDGLAELAAWASAAGQASAEAVTDGLAQLFSGLVEDIHRYSGGLMGGGVLKFSGERLLAFFDADVLLDQHALHAANAALAIQARMTTAADPRGHNAGSQLKLRIGLHSGQFLAAEVGDATHLELVITGTPAARAFTALALAPPDGIVVSQDTQDLLPMASSHAAQPGYYQLSYAPHLPTPRIPSRWGWEAGSGNMAELRRLTERIASLQPYLPFGFDQLAAANPADLHPIPRLMTLLCARITPVNLLLDQFAADSELAARVLNAYYRRAQATLHTYGGMVCRISSGTSGDYLLAAFGTQVGQEDHALQAVRAAVALRQALAEANAEIADLINLLPDQQRTSSTAAQQQRPERPLALNQQIGIATGSVLTTLAGSNRRRDYSLLGLPPVLAQRIARTAGLDEIRLAPATLHLVEQRVAARMLTPLPIGLQNEPVAAAVLLRLHDSGLHTLVSPALRPALIGRSNELERLQQTAEQVVGGTGQVVTISGDAGSGKTRLVEELLQRLVFRYDVRRRLPPFRVFSLECRSSDRHARYAAIRELVRRLLALPGADQGAAGSHYGGFSTVGDLPARERALMIDDEADRSAAGTPQQPAAGAEQRFTAICELCVGLVRSIARRQPVALLIDDLHRADDVSRAVLAHLARAIADLPVLLVITTRDNVPATGLSALPGQLIRLHDLATKDSTALLQALLGSAPPADLVTLWRPAAGNPFFMQEVVHSLVERGELFYTSGAWHLRSSLSAAALPPSIDRIVRTQLDRLTSAERTVVAAAAVVGQWCPRNLLVALAAVPQAATHCHALEQHGWFAATADMYGFRQTLLRDIVYDHTPLQQRRELHGRLVALLATETPEPAADRVEQLARHSLLAADWPRAFVYQMRSGTLALSRQDYRAALAAFENALRISAQLPDLPREQQADLYERSGVSAALLGQYDTALAHFDKVLALIKRRQGAVDRSVHMRLRRQIAAIHTQRTDYAAAGEWLASALDCSDGPPDVEAARCMFLDAQIAIDRGEYRRAAALAQDAHKLVAGQDSGGDTAHALGLLAACHEQCGESAQALELAGRSLRIFQRLDDLQGQAGAHLNLGRILFRRGRWHEAGSHYQNGARLAATTGTAALQATAAYLQGIALYACGATSAAISQWRLAQRGWQHSRFGSGMIAMHLGAAFLQSGDHARARQHLDHSTTLLTQTGGTSMLPDLYRFRAELALDYGDAIAAQLDSQAALRHACRQGARLEEGTARRVLAQALLAQGDLNTAAAELDHSLAILEAVDSRYEAARTRLAIAALAPLRRETARGQAALWAAIVLLTRLEARNDLARAEQIAVRWRYQLEYAAQAGG